MRLAPNARAACAYASDHQIAVFALQPGTKEPMPGSRGENDGTTDLVEVERTWRKFPNAGIGAALRFTPWFVVDVDARAFGDEWLDALETGRGRLPHTATSVTGSGNPSAHLWFRRTPDLDGVLCRKLTHGVDVKGLRAGYVVLPPSRHPLGTLYRWEASSRIDEVPIADPPKWLASMLREKTPRWMTDAPLTAPVNPDTFYLGALFKHAHMLGPQVRPGVFCVRCPNETAHHAGAPFDSSTVIFAPKIPGGRGTFFCSHTSACSEVFR